MPTDAIIFENVSKKYGNFRALSDLDLKVSSNTSVGFLGPNGAGKSTAIKILTGLARPSSGNAFIFGKNPAKNLVESLSNVGVLVEIPQFYSNLTPEDTLTYFGKIRGMNGSDLQHQITKILEIINLTDWRRKKVSTFSKGMKQRLGIGCALLHEPTLLILDEPATGLDPRGMIEIRQILHQLKKEGKTIFMSSHLLSEVQEVCDVVAILDKGKLVRYDSVKNISTQNHLLQKIKIECIVEPTPGQISTLEKLDYVKKIEKLGGSLVVDFAGTLEEKADLLDFMTNSQMRVISFNSLSSELESLYMSETSESVQ